LRHTLRVYIGLRRRSGHACAKSGLRARISITRRASCRDAWNHRLRRNDLWSGLDELDAFDRLAPDRPHLLFQLRQTPQPHQHAAAGNARRYSVDAVVRQSRLTPAALAKSAKRAARPEPEERAGPTRKLFVIDGIKSAPRRCH